MDENLMRARGPASAAALSDVGRRRAANQDACFADPDRGLYVVADGVGGGPAGEVAAQRACIELPLLLREEEDLLRSLPAPLLRKLLRNRVLGFSQALYLGTLGHPETRGMGTTIVLAYARGGWLHVVHLGDSRAYLLRDEELLRLTEDHSMVGALVRSGRMSRMEARHHPSRGWLTRCAGMNQPARPDAVTVRLHQGDRLVLCTDGLWDLVPEREMARLARGPAAPSTVCRAMVDAANHAGGTDNITVVVADLLETIGDPGSCDRADRVRGA